MTALNWTAWRRASRMASLAVLRRLSQPTLFPMCREGCHDAALESFCDCRPGHGGARGSDLLSNSAETSDARRKIATAEPRAGAARIDTTGRSESSGSSREDEPLLGLGCGRLHAGAGDSGAAAFEGSGAAVEASAEHAPGRPRGCRTVYAAAGCGAARLLSVAGWNGGRRCFPSAGDLDSLRDRERTVGGGFHHADTGGQRAAGAAAENPDSWAGSGNIGGTSGSDRRVRGLKQANANFGGPAAYRARVGKNNRANERE